MKYTYLVVCVAVVAMLGVTESEAFRLSTKELLEKLSGSLQRSDSLQARSEGEDDEPSEETLAMFAGLARICEHGAFNPNTEKSFATICNGIIDVKALFEQCESGDGQESMGKQLNKHKYVATCVLLSEYGVEDDCKEVLKFEAEDVTEEVKEFRDISENECGQSQERELKALFSRLLDEVKRRR